VIALILQQDVSVGPWRQNGRPESFVPCRRPAGTALAPIDKVIGEKVKAPAAVGGVLGVRGALAVR
jgi:hypothetical protein